MGDSLSAAYGLSQHQSWVALLSTRLQQQAYPHRVVNASISGETSQGGLLRLQQQLSRVKPAVVVIALGGNDGLRGLSLTALQGQLLEMVQLSKNRGAQVLLAGVRMPPNYGIQFTQQFAQVYSDVAHATSVAFLPNLLKAVDDQTTLMQADLIHPNGRGQAVILDNIWPVLLTLLKNTQQRTKH